MRSSGSAEAAAPRCGTNEHESNSDSSIGSGDVGELAERQREVARLHERVDATTFGDPRTREHERHADEIVERDPRRLAREPAMAGVVAVVRGERDHRAIEREVREQRTERVVDLVHQRRAPASGGARSASSPCVADPPRASTRRRRSRSPRGTPRGATRSPRRRRSAARCPPTSYFVAYGPSGLSGVCGCGNDTTRNRGRSSRRASQEGLDLVDDPRRGVVLEAVRERRRPDAVGPFGDQLRRPPGFERAPRRDPLVDQPLVVVVEIRRTVGAQPEHGGAEVLAGAHHVEAVTGVHRGEVHLADQRGLVAGAAHRVRDRPHPFAQRVRAEVRRQPARLDAREQPGARRDARRGRAVGAAEHDPPRRRARRARASRRRRRTRTRPGRAAAGRS